MLSSHGNRTRYGAASPSPLPIAPSSSSAAVHPLTSATGKSPSAAPTAAKNILKHVESHIRLMTYVENVSVSSSFTALRLRKSKADGGGSPSPSAVGRSPSATSGDAPSSWSQPFSVGRVHRGADTATFYREVVAPCIYNSCSGQSYLFLVSGPHESGRSQTLYGSPHHSEKGLIELTAADYIARMKTRRRMMAETQEDGGATSSTNKENPETGGGVSTEKQKPTGGLVVTYAAFTTRAAHIVDTVTGATVPVEEFPSPLGAVPLPQMELLGEDDDPARIVLLPDKKHTDTSCVIQFHVYAPVGSGAAGRRSMATVTFVDVAAFRTPLCPEVAHLVDTVRRVAGLGSECSGPNYKDSQLTTLLEPALVGYVTLVSITTISGRPDLYDSACAALQFASDISRIHQVLMLTHIQTPRWLFDAGVGLHQLRQQRAQLMYSHYTRGVHDFYKRTTTWLLRNVCDVGSGLEHILAETEKVRQDVNQEVTTQAAELEAKIEQEDNSCRREVAAARAAYEASTQQFEELKRLDARIAAIQQEIAHTDMHYNQRMTEIRLKISDLESKRHAVQQETHQFDREENLYTQKTSEVLGILDRYADDLCLAQCKLLEGAITAKRCRLEEELEAASHVAHRRTEHSRTDRRRRSLLSQLAGAQRRVNRLRESSTPPPPVNCVGKASPTTTRTSTLAVPTASSRQRVAATRSRRAQLSQSPVLDLRDK